MVVIAVLTTTHNNMKKNILTIAALLLLTLTASADNVMKKEADGTLSCRGEQLARKCPKGTEQGNIDNDDYVKLDGTIEIVDKDHLIFNGEIRTKVYHINNGQEVLRQGTFNFVTKENRHYWRMQEQLNPADECTDYIDIYYSK